MYCYVRKIILMRVNTLPASLQPSSINRILRWEQSSVSICMQPKKQGTILASDKFHEWFSSMHSIKVNTYNPFTKSFLGFSLSSNFSNENYSLNLLDNLDLYHQPLDHPSRAISLFVALFKLFLFNTCSNGDISLFGICI